MSATPPQKHLHECDPTDAQLKQAKRIAAKTGRTVEQVLAEAISRGASAQFSEALAGRAVPGRNPH